MTEILVLKLSISREKEQKTLRMKNLYKTSLERSYYETN